MLPPTPSTGGPWSHLAGRRYTLALALLSTLAKIEHARGRLVPNSVATRANVRLRHVGAASP